MCCCIDLEPKNYIIYNSFINTSYLSIFTPPGVDLAFAINFILVDHFNETVNTPTSE